MSKDYGFKNLKNNEGENLQKVKSRNKTTIFQFAIILMLLAIICGGILFTNAIFTSNDSQTSYMQFAGVGVNAAVSTNGTNRTQSNNVKFITNYTNDSSFNVLENASVSLIDQSIPAFMRAQAQFAFVDVEDKNLTNSLKAVITKLNDGAIVPFSSAEYKWEKVDDGYYYLVNNLSVPYMAIENIAYKFVSDSAPVTYNAISDLNLSFSAEEKVILSKLAFVLNFECVQHVEGISTIEELKARATQFASGVKQKTTHGNILMFNVDGGDNLPAVFTEGKSVSLSAYVPTKTGYTFKGWEGASISEGYVHFGEDKIEHVRALWQVNTYNIAYKDEGGKEYSGSSISSPITYTYGQSVLLPTSVSKQGFSFIGWFSDAECTKAVSSISSEQVGNVTVYAKWNANDIKINYLGMDGAQFVSEAVTSFPFGSKESIVLPNVHKYGYQFLGWYDGLSDDALLVDYIYTYDYTSDVNLYAKFEALSYTIKFNSNGGSGVVQDITYTSQVGFTLPDKDALVRYGSELSGWKVVKADNSNWKLNSIYMPGANYEQDPINYRYGNVTLEANWSVDLSSIILQFYDIEGQVGSDYQVSVDSDVVLPYNLNLVSSEDNATLDSITSLYKDQILLGWSRDGTLGAAVEYVDIYHVDAAHAIGDCIKLYAIFADVSYYAIINGSTYKYEVYGVSENSDYKFLYSTNSLQVAIQGIEKCTEKQDVNIHFGASIDFGNVRDSLNILDDTVSISNFDNVNTLNFVKGSIVSERSALNIENSDLLNKTPVISIGEGITVNVGTNNTSFSVLAYSYFFGVKGVLNIVNAKLQLGTSKTLITKANSIVASVLENAEINFYQNSSVLYYGNTGAQYAAIANILGSVKILGGKFEAQNSGSIVYNESSTLISAGSFVARIKDGQSGACVYAFSGVTGIDCAQDCTIYMDAKLSGNALYVTGNAVLNIGSGYYQSEDNHCVFVDNASANVPSVTISGGEFVSNTHKEGVAVVAVLGGSLTISSGVVRNYGSGYGVYSDDNGAIKIDGNANIVSDNKYALYVSGESKVEIGGVAKISSLNDSAIYQLKQSLLTFVLNDTSGVIVDTSANAPTMYILSGVCNIYGVTTIQNSSVNGANASVIEVCASATLNVKSALNVTIKANSVSVDAHAIDVFGNLNVEAFSTNYLYVISSYGNALMLNDGASASLGSGLYISEQNHSVCVQNAVLSLSGSAVVSKHTMDYANGIIASSSHAYAIYSSSNASVMLLEGAVVRSYKSVAIYFDYCQCDGTLSLNANTAVVSENDYAIYFGHYGEQAGIYLAQNAMVKSNGVTADIYSRVEGVIYAKDLLGQNVFTGNGINGAPINIFYHQPELELVNGTVVVKQVEDSSKTLFYLTNFFYTLAYLGEDVKELVIGRQNSIQYDLNGGSLPNGQIFGDPNYYKEGEVVDILFTPTPIRDGYTFMGWSEKKYTSSPTYTIDINNTIVMPNNNVLLYAVWKLQYVKMYFDDNEVAATYYYSLDEAMNAFSSTQIEGNVVTFELLRSNISTSMSYGVGVNLSGENITNVANDNIKYIKIVGADLPFGVTLPTTSLYMFSQNLAFAIGEGYTLEFENVILDGTSVSSQRKTSRFALVQGGNLVLGANAIIQNFVYTSNDLIDENSQNQASRGGAIYVASGSFTMKNTSVMQDCSIVYSPKDNGGNYLNLSETNSFAGGVIYAESGQISIDAGAKIHNCSVNVIAEYNSNNNAEEKKVYGIVWLNGQTAKLNFKGSVTNSIVNVKNLYAPNHAVPSYDVHTMSICGVGISLTQDAKMIANGNESFATIQNCYAYIESYTAYVHGVGVYIEGKTLQEVGQEHLIANKLSITDCYAVAKDYKRGSMQGVGIFAENVLSSISLTNSMIEDCQGEIGVAIYTEGIIYAYNSSFKTYYGQTIYLSGDRSSSSDVRYIFTSCNIENYGEAKGDINSAIWLASGSFGTMLLDSTTIYSNGSTSMIIDADIEIMATNSTKIQSVQGSAIVSVSNYLAYYDSTTSIIVSGDKYAIIIDAKEDNDQVNSVCLVYEGVIENNGSSGAIYANTLATIKLLGGSITTNSNDASIVLGKGNQEINEKERLVVDGAVIENAYVGGDNSSIVELLDSFYGVVNLLSGSLISHSEGSAIYTGGVEHVFENDEQRLNFEGANSVINIAGSVSILNDVGSAIYVENTYLNVVGGQITSQKTNVILANYNAYAVIDSEANMTLTGQSESMFLMQAQNGNGGMQYLYINNGNFNVQYGTLLFTANKQGQTNDQKQVVINGGTFVGGSQHSLGKAYIYLTANTNLTINGGVFGDEETDLTSPSQDIISSYTFINSEALNNVITINNATINAEEIFFVNTSGDAIVNLNGGNIIVYNAVFSGLNLSVDIDGWNAMFMINLGAPIINISAGNFRALNAHFIYNGLNAKSTTNISGGQISVESNAYYIYYNESGSELSTLNLGGEIVFNCPSAKWFRVTAQKQISAKCASSAILPSVADMAIEFVVSSPQENQVVVTNVNIEVGVENAKLFYLTDPAGFYLELDGNNLVLKQTQYYVVYNRNFMQSYEEGIENVGNFGITGTSYDGLYKLSNIEYDFVEGRDIASDGKSNHNQGVTKALVKNGFARTGYSFNGWSISSDGEADYTDEQEVQMLTSCTSTIVNLGGKDIEAQNSERVNAINSNNSKALTIRLYANWVADKGDDDVDGYKINIDLNGGNWTQTLDTQYAYGTKLDLVEPSRKDYTFDGWMETRMIDGVLYQRVLYHDAYNTEITPTATQNGQQVFADIDMAKFTNDSVYLYSNLISTGAIKESVLSTVAIPDNYAYMLEYHNVYSGDNFAHNIWTQANSPTNPSDNIIDYNPIDVELNNKSFGGLLLSKDSTTYLDGTTTVDTDNDYYAVGAYNFYNNGIKVDDGKYAYGSGVNTFNVGGTSFPVSLWQRVGDGNIANIDAKYTTAAGDVIYYSGNKTGVYYVKDDVTLTALWRQVKYQIYLGDDYDLNLNPTLESDNYNDIRSFLEDPTKSEYEGVYDINNDKDKHVTLRVCHTVTESLDYTTILNGYYFTDIDIVGSKAQTTWTLRSSRNFFVLGSETLTTNVNLNVENITITQGRTKNSTTTGRFAHVLKGGHLKINDYVTFIDFYNVEQGAVILNAGKVTIDGQNTVFESCYTTSYGGVVASYTFGYESELNTGTDLIVNNATFVNCQALGGGVIFADGIDSASEFITTIVINNGVFGNTTGDYNTAENGAVIYAQNGAIINIRGGSFAGNKATENGGFMYLTSGAKSTINGENSEINNNTAENGGAVFVNDGAVLNIQNATISSNIASNNGGAIASNEAIINVSGGLITLHTATSGNGGAIYTLGGEVHVSGGSIASNRTLAENALGGAVYIEGSTNSSVTGSAEITANVSQYQGGAIYLEQSTLNINGDSVKISLNQGQVQGGAIFVGNKSNLTVTAGLIEQNTSANEGGGIYVAWNSLLTKINGEKAQIKLNTGTYGAGVYLQASDGADKPADSGEFEISAGYISENTASVNGGGVYVQTVLDGTDYISAMFSIKDSGNINANSAILGAGVYFDYNANIEGGNIYANEAISYGGGVFVNNGTFNMVGGSIYGNKAVSGAGVYLTKDVLTTSISGGQIGNDLLPNIAQERGGAIYVQAGTITISKDAIIGSSDKVVASATDRANHAVSGAGIDALSATVLMTGGIIGRNYASSQGAGVYANAVLKLQGGDIQYNTAATNGGGVLSYSDTAVLQVSNTIIHHNATLLSDGGGAGLYIEEDVKSVEFGAITLHSNSSAGNGGGLYMKTKNYTLVLDDDTIYGNSAQNGGGIYMFNSNITISAGAVVGKMNYPNVATANGGALYLNGGSLTLSTGGVLGDDLSVVATSDACANKANSGAGAYLHNCTFTMDGGVIGANYAENQGGGIYTNSVATLNDGDIKYNSASFGGGVLISGSEAAVSLLGVDIHHNKVHSAAGGGGGLCIYTSIKETNFSAGNVYSNVSLGFGGGIYIRSSTFENVISGMGIYQNEAVNGAGVCSEGSLKLDSGMEIHSNVASSNGGGVYVGSGKTTVIESVIRNNSALEGNGGGLYVASGSAIITKSKIYSNASAYGAGVYSQGNLTINESSEIYSNEASQNGGGVFVGGGITSIVNSKIYKNKALVNGGGALINEGETTLNSVEISENQANSGGGIATAGKLSLTNVTIVSNKAIANGGAIALLAGGNGVLNSGDINSNTALNGGAIYMEGGALNIIGGQIGSDQTSKANRATNYGGGVYAVGGKLTMDGGVLGSTVETIASSVDFANAANCGSMIYSTDGAEVIINGGVIGRGYSSQSGGAIYMAGGSVSLASCYVQYNATSASGGAIAVYSNASLTLNTNAQIKNNVAAEHGGAIAIYGTGELNGTGGTICLNTAEKSGGAIYTEGSGVVSGLTIYSNTGKLSGGAIYVVGGDAKIGGDIYSNQTQGSGGAVYIDSDSQTAFTLGEGNVHSNTIGSNLNGGAIYVNKGVLAIDGAKIYNHTALNGAGAYVKEGSTLSILSGQIGNDTSANKATENGGGVYCEGDLSISDGYIGTNSTSIATATSNANSAKNGGALYITSTANVNLSGGAITRGYASENGGGLYLPCNANLTSGKFSYNCAGANGGGVYIATGCVVTASGLTITYNGAVDGAGVYMAANCNATISGGTINNNVASGNGGGVYGQSYLTLSNSATIGLASSSSMPTSSNCGNKATAGAGLYFADGTLTINSANIAYNYSTGAYGSAIHFVKGTATVNANIEANYSAATIATDVIVENGSFTFARGKITSRQADRSAIVANAGTLTISGGVLTANAGSNYATVFADGTSVVYVTGGSIVENGGGSAALRFKTVGRVSGGEMSANSTSSYPVRIDSETAKLYLSGMPGFTGNTSGYSVYTQWASTIYGKDGTNNFSHNSSNTMADGYRLRVHYNATPSVGTVIVESVETGALSMSYGVNFNSSSAGFLPQYMPSVKQIQAQSSGSGSVTNKFYLGYTGQGATYSPFFNYSSENYATANRAFVWQYISTSWQDVLSSYNSSTHGSGYNAFISVDVANIDLSATSTISSQSTKVIVYDHNINGYATFKATSGNITMIDASCSYLELKYIYLNGNSQSNVNGVDCRNFEATSTVSNYGVKVENCTAGGIYANGYANITNGYISGCTSTSNGGGLHFTSSSTISKLTVNNCKTTSGNGGGIYANGSSSTISNSTISGCSASGNGGGIYAGNSIEITSTTISSCSSSSNGGGIYASSTVTLDATNVSGCTATSNGGGVFAYSGTFTMQNSSKVYSCSAVNGGGLYVDTTTYIETNSQVYNNSASNSGGGVYQSSSLYLSNACIGGTSTSTASSSSKSNYATLNGGGVYMDSGTLYLQESGKVNYNYAGGDGGGIYKSGGSFSFTAGNQISYNCAAGNGGGLYMSGGTIQGATISKNKATYGGGIYNSSSSLTLNNTIVGSSTSTSTASSSSSSSNYASQGGGGVYQASTNGVSVNSGSYVNYNYASGNGGGICSNGNVTVSGGYVNYNGASGNGGGVYGNKSSISLNSGEISVNKATNGGGAYVYDYDSFSMSGGSMHKNYASGSGGAVYATDNASVSIDGGVIGNASASSNASSTYSNYASSNGGAIFANSSADVTISSSAKILQNRATQGGGIAIEGDASLYVNSSSVVIAYNYASSTGGGVALCGNASFSFTYGTIGTEKSDYVKSTSSASNVAGSNGGGIAILDFATISMNNNAKVLGNGASTGGGIYIATSDIESSFTLRGTISYNYASSRAAGMYLNTGKMEEFSSGTVNYNYTSGDGGGIYFADGGSIKNSGTLKYNYGKNGGAAYFAETSVLSSVTITDNSGADGGALYFADVATLNSVTMKNNTASNRGGAVYFGGTNAEIIGGSYTYNTAKEGGAIFASPNTLFKMNITSSSSTTVSNNSATASGGAIYIQGDTELKNVTASYNTASGSGGAICGSTSSIPYVKFISCTFNNNTAGDRGGAICAWYNMHFDACSINYNTANDRHGGGIYSGPNNELNLYNGTSVSNNQTSGDGAGIYAEGSTIISGGKLDSKVETSDLSGWSTASPSTITITGNAGICSTCGGDGKITCSKCGGDGLVPAGMGDDSCSSCGGDGTFHWAWESDQGRGWNGCSDCGGSGETAGSGRTQGSGSTVSLTTASGWEHMYTSLSNISSGSGTYNISIWYNVSSCPKGYIDGYQGFIMQVLSSSPSSGSIGSRTGVSGNNRGYTECAISSGDHVASLTASSGSYLDICFGTLVDGSSINITIKKIVITRGSSTVNIKNNTASSDKQGGGLVIKGITVLHNASISSNIAGIGGGFVKGSKSLSISGSTSISSNTSTNASSDSNINLWHVAKSSKTEYKVANLTIVYHKLGTRPQSKPTYSTGSSESSNNIRSGSSAVVYVNKIENTGNLGYTNDQAYLKVTIVFNQEIKQASSGSSYIKMGFKYGGTNYKYSDTAQIGAISSRTTNIYSITRSSSEIDNILDENWGYQFQFVWVFQDGLECMIYEYLDDGYEVDGDMWG